MASIQDRFFSQNRVEHNRLEELDSGIFKDGGHSHLVPLVDGTESNIKQGSLRVDSTSADIYLGGGNWLPLGADDSPTLASLTVTGNTSLQSDLTVLGSSFLKNTGVEGVLLVSGDIGAEQGLYVTQNLGVGGDTAFSGHVAANSTLFVGNRATVGSAVGSSGVLEVNGDTIVSDRLDVGQPGFTGGTLAVNGSLGVNGDTLINGGLFINAPAGAGRPLLIDTSTGRVYYQP